MTRTRKARIAKRKATPQFVEFLSANEQIDGFFKMAHENNIEKQLLKRNVMIKQTISLLPKSHHTAAALVWDQITNALDASSLNLQNRGRLRTRIRSISQDSVISSEASAEPSNNQPIFGNVKTSNKTVRRSQSMCRLGNSYMTQQTSKLKFQTPSKNTSQNISYGSVTPKVQPNSVQMILRRPRQGEMALSLQGSPLYTNAVVSDIEANINVPLDDGRILAIQPRTNFRISEIPPFDDDVRLQLEALRDNLNKIMSQHQ